MTARLHVLLGQGGVGKTTLAAALALALSREGRRVGLLGIDPARRLQGALGLGGCRRKTTAAVLAGAEAPVAGPGELPEEPIAVAGFPGLGVALLRPEQSLRRWVAEQCPDEAARRALVENPFFIALADRMASAADAFAGIRVAEWAERDPALDDLVVDTAPGLHGLSFVARPDQLLAFLRGRLLRWLGHFAWGRKRHGATARRVLGGLADVGGAGVLLRLGEFALLLQEVAATMTARLERARTWLRDGTTGLLLVAAPRPDAAAGVRGLAEALRELGLAPGAVVLNRALPPELADGEAIPDPEGEGEARAFVRYLRGFAALQGRVRAELSALGRVVEIEAAEGLDSLGEARLEALCRLGARMIEALRAGALLAPRRA